MILEVSPLSGSAVFRNERRTLHQKPADAHVLADGFDFGGAVGSSELYAHREFQVETTVLSFLLIAPLYRVKRDAALRVAAIGTYVPATILRVAGRCRCTGHRLMFGILGGSAIWQKLGGLAHQNQNNLSTEDG